jgi:hypothetical protein
MTKCKFLDITMLRKEFGGQSIPLSHRDRAEFTNDLPYQGTEFNFVFCDGRILRTHARETCQKRGEVSRLRCAQLVLALHHIKPGGTMVVLPHKVDAWGNVRLLAHVKQILLIASSSNPESSMGLETRST